MEKWSQCSNCFVNRSEEWGVVDVAVGKSALEVTPDKEKAWRGPFAVALAGIVV